MFDIPFFRTLRMQSNDTVSRTRNELVATEEGPVSLPEQIKHPKSVWSNTWPAEMSSGNFYLLGVHTYIEHRIFRSSFEIDTRNLTRPTLRIELVIDGKIRYRLRLILLWLFIR